MYRVTQLQIAWRSSASLSSSGKCLAQAAPSCSATFKAVNVPRALVKYVSADFSTSATQTCQSGTWSPNTACQAGMSRRVTCAASRKAGRGNKGTAAGPEQLTVSAKTSSSQSAQSRSSTAASADSLVRLAKVCTPTAQHTGPKRVCMCRDMLLVPRGTQCPAGSDDLR